MITEHSNDCTIKVTARFPDCTQRPAVIQVLKPVNNLNNRLYTLYNCKKVENNIAYTRNSA